MLKYTYIGSVFHADSKYVICFGRKPEYANQNRPNISRKVPFLPIGTKEYRT